MDLTNNIENVVRYSPKVDELFSAESKTELLTNSDYDFDGSHSIKIWKMNSVDMNDYARNVNDETQFDEVKQLSRYGKLLDLTAQTEMKTLRYDRSFIFNIDRLDQNETSNALAAETALMRQIREKVIPEVDKNCYQVMTEGAGTIKEAAKLTKTNIYTSILAGSETLDDAEVPDTERVLVVTPAVYTLLKQAVEFDNLAIADELRRLGVIQILDGMKVIKVPASRLPEGFGFMIAHPAATTAAAKLEEYKVSDGSWASSGSIVTGRVVYDAFVLDNKKKGIYYQPISTAE